MAKLFDVTVRKLNEESPTSNQHLKLTWEEMERDCRNYLIPSALIDAVGVLLKAPGDTIRFTSTTDLIYWDITLEKS